MAKKYKISSAVYEFAFRYIQDKYSVKDYALIDEFMSAWVDHPTQNVDKERGFFIKDGYDYVDSIDELIPNNLSINDKKRFVAEVKKNLIKL